MNKKCPVFIFCGFFILSGHAQRTGIGTNTPNASAQVDIASTIKGLLMPRMNTSSVALIVSPAKGLMVYDSSRNQLLVNTGSQAVPNWQALAFTGGWTLSGNSGTNPSIHFIGTTDNIPLRFRVNNKYAGEIDSTQSKTFFGYLAGKNATSGYGNVGIGCKSLGQLTVGHGNAAIGDSAQFSDTSGSYNTGVGAYALHTNIFGGMNTATGALSLYNAINANGNTVMGFGAMYNLQNVSYNTGLGAEALNSIVSGGGNTAIGYQAILGDNNSGSSNTGVGWRTFWINTTGSRNTANGYNALSNNETSSENTAAGYSALVQNRSGDYNSAIGSMALSTSQFDRGNTATGYAALKNNHGPSNDPTVGINNTATGAEALASNAIGYENTATGRRALYSNLTGNINTAIGSGALYSNNSGVYNSAIGYAAMYSSTSTDWNTGIGVNALFANNGYYNTVVGGGALSNTTSSQRNTVVGYNSAVIYDMGYNNTIVGANCDVTGAGYYNCIAIGQAVSCNGVCQARFGNTATWSIGGYAGWSNISDGRFKREVREDVKGLDFVMKLRPVTYHLDLSGVTINAVNPLRTDTAFRSAVLGRQETTSSGFVAQEVETATRETGYNFSGLVKPQNENDVYALRYAEFVVPLIKGVQEQQVALDHLKLANSTLWSQVAEQERIYKNLLKRIEKIEASFTVSKN